jgi:hypothetical protein
MCNTTTTCTCILTGSTSAYTVEDFESYVAALLAAISAADDAAVDDSNSSASDTNADATELDEPWVKSDEV